MSQTGHFLSSFISHPFGRMKDEPNPVISFHPSSLLASSQRMITMLRLPSLLGFVLIFAIFMPAPAQAQLKKFRAGAFAQDITPAKFPISVNGGMTDRQATKAYDRLHARCLVLDDGA